MRYQLTLRPAGLRVLACTIAALGALAVTALAATPALAKKGGTVWLCNPDAMGKGKTMCLKHLKATTVTYSGGMRVETGEKEVPTRADKPIDCFYVYPTVSGQEGTNAELTGPKHNKPEAAEEQIVIDQASRFSKECNVFAPWYPQLTLKAINTPGMVTESATAKAYLGMASAFFEYLQKYNGGKPIVFIGHSQGSLLLEHLIAESFDQNTMADEAMRSKLVSAILLGGNVLVPEGKLVGGTFKNIPACQSATEVHCVVAYSSFAKEPPEGAFFGRANSPLIGGGSHEGEEVVCVNPTLATQNGAAGPLVPFASTTTFPGALGELAPAPTVQKKSPWVTSPGLYTAQCKHENKASWLQISFAQTEAEEGAGVRSNRASHNELVVEDIPPEPQKWGLHLYDVTLGLGNLVPMVGEEAKAF